LPSAALLALTAAILALTPAYVSSTASLRQTVQVTIALTAILLINLALIRRAVDPIERLMKFMSRVDPLEPGRRAPTAGGSAESVALAKVFNEMLERVEAERRNSAVRMLSAQEEERVRLARELHDQIGQSVTGLMLELDAAAKQAPAVMVPRLRDVQEAAREISHELQEIVRQLRPEALDMIGLRAAIIALADRFAGQGPMKIDLHLAEDLPELSPEAELVVYRVAQESLTNAVRHSGASKVLIELKGDSKDVELRVSDAGRGMAMGATPGNGIRGMRERAVLVGARLTIESSAPEDGLEVMLQVPGARAGELE
jgi:two-component system sensor histidine kinase UhpB